MLQNTVLVRSLGTVSCQHRVSSPTKTGFCQCQQYGVPKFLTGQLLIFFTNYCIFQKFIERIKKLRKIIYVVPEVFDVSIPCPNSSDTFLVSVGLEGEYRIILNHCLELPRGYIVVLIK